MKYSGLGKIGIRPNVVDSLYYNVEVWSVMIGVIFNGPHPTVKNKVKYPVKRLQFRLSRLLLSSVHSNSVEMCDICNQCTLDVAFCKCNITNLNLKVQL